MLVLAYGLWLREEDATVVDAVRMLAMSGDFGQYSDSTSLRTEGLSRGRVSTSILYIYIVSQRPGRRRGKQHLLHTDSYSPHHLPASASRIRAIGALRRSDDTLCTIQDNQSQASSVWLCLSHTSTHATDISIDRDTFAASRVGHGLAIKTSLSISMVPVISGPRYQVSLSTSSHQLNIVTTAKV